MRPGSPTPASDRGSHQFLSPELLDEPSATVSNGQLAPDGPAYDVLVVYEDDFAGENTLLVETAERVLEFAQAGLPIVIVGDSYHVPGIPHQGEDEQLQSLLAGILSRATVGQGAAEADIGVALSDPDVEPDLSYAEPSPLLNAHRSGDDVDYYYVHNPHNPSDASVEHRVSAHTTATDARPFDLDPWTGEVDPVFECRSSGSRVRAIISFESGESARLAVGDPDWYDGDRDPGLHATSSEANEVRAVGGDLVIRDTETGAYSTALSSGRTVTTTIDDLPYPITLTGWELSVEGWRPGDSPTDTDIVTHEPSLDSLKPWTEIPELEDVSGVGTYETTIDLGDDWVDANDGAYLDLGEVVDTFQITMNGERLLPVDQVNPVVDVSAYLRSGTNSIQVEVATTLLNRLRASNPDVYGREGINRQEDGLLGPVELIPYGQAEITPSLPPIDDFSPTDPDDDGHYEDVDGDGEASYRDVVALFRSFEDPAIREHTEAYDFNGNGERDYDDIVELFRSIGE